MNMMKLPMLAMMLSLASISGVPQSASTPSNLPHPETPSLRVIEDSSRMGAGRGYEAPPKLSKEERARIDELRAPRVDDKLTFATFLSKPGSGIVRLLPDDDCVKNLVVRVDGACVNHIPGASGFNVRKNATLGPDLRIERQEMISDGFFALSSLVSLGDVDIESLSLDSVGVSDLVLLEPAITLANAKAQARELLTGTLLSAPFQSNRRPYELNTTYALRVVAFGASNTSYKPIGRDRYGLGNQALREKFALMRYDTRSDVVAVVRVIRVDEDGSVSLIWRKLREVKAPKLRFDDKENLTDLK